MMAKPMNGVARVARATRDSCLAIMEWWCRAKEEDGDASDRAAKIQCLIPRRQEVRDWEARVIIKENDRRGLGKRGDRKSKILGLFDIEPKINFLRAGVGWASINPDQCFTAVPQSRWTLVGSRRLHGDDFMTHFALDPELHLIARMRSWLAVSLSPYLLHSLTAAMPFMTINCQHLPDTKGRNGLVISLRHIKADDWIYSVRLLRMLSSLVGPAYFPASNHILRCTSSIVGIRMSLPLPITGMRLWIWLLGLCGVLR